jgi:hypothetical protein
MTAASTPAAFATARHRDEAERVVGFLLGEQISV